MALSSTAERHGSNVTPAAPGVRPSKGTQTQLGSRPDRSDFLDASTFTTLALATASAYRSQIDWRRSVQCALDKCGQMITVSGQEFRGFNIVQTPTAARTA
jgi:hypothetical protein